MGSETSLRFQIQELEKIIAIKEKQGENTKFERRLLKSWRKYAEDGFDTSGTSARNPFRGGEVENGTEDGGTP